MTVLNFGIDLLRTINILFEQSVFRFGNTVQSKRLIIPLGKDSYPSFLPKNRSASLSRLAIAEILKEFRFHFHNYHLFLRNDITEFIFYHKFLKQSTLSAIVTQPCLRRNPRVIFIDKSVKIVYGCNNTIVG